MKDVLCLAVFASKVACLVVFVNVLKPDVIRTAEAPSQQAVVALVSGTRIERCRAAAEGLSLLKEQAC